MGAPFRPPRAGQETEVRFPYMVPFSRPAVLPVLFEKLPSREERLPATGDDEVVRLPLSEEANGTFRRQRPPNTVPPDGTFDVVAHGLRCGLWHRETPAEPRLPLADCSPLQEEVSVSSREFSPVVLSRTGDSPLGL